MNEGGAAALAEAEASESNVAEEARVARLIAREEAGHAALAFDVLRWALTQMPELAQMLPRGATPHVGVTSLGGARGREVAQQSAARAALQRAELVA